MADDSEYINETFDFHPCATPRGMLYYKLTELTEEQQTRLNRYKIDVIRSNQKYLHTHPEIRLIISKLLRAVLRARPKHSIHKFLVEYLMDIWPDLKKEVDAVTRDRLKKETIERQRQDTLSYLKALYEDEGLEEADEMSEDELQKKINENAERHTKLLCRHILEEIVGKVEAVEEKRHVKIQIVDSSSGSDVELDLGASGAPDFVFE
ncbi:hypothetical protein NQ315_015724 [Exocentrus adspersus]|uniref:Uncharacterized protein n=1 Tax=Exocentrus adspersus TaxID=1586481 RepID=A0AAV8W4B1_9CUCU|nr:hypothetical protein NQ315_015724 [Exocentrus adspersus]